MLAVSAVAFVALSACVGQVAARAGPDAHIAHAVRSLERRADSASSSPSSSTFLSDVFQMETPRCSSTCEVSLGGFDSCSQLSSQATIAACACSAQTLGDLRACASCISTTTKSDSNSTAVVSAYNSFVNLCLQEGLVSVTGTVEVGASTKSMARSSFSTATSSGKASSASASATASSTSLPASITSTSSLATYNPSRPPVSTATVPSLIASGSIASSARAAAASAASAAPVSSTNEKTSGAAPSRTAGQAVVAVVALAAGVAFLA